MSTAPYLDPQVKATLDQLRKRKADPRFPLTTEESERARQLKGVPTVNQAPWSTLRQAVTKATEPTPMNPNTTPQNQTWAANRDAAWNAMANASSVGGNILKRIGRVLFGAVDLFPQAADILHRLGSSDEKVSEQAETELLNLHPGAQIADRMKEAIDEWKKSKSLAAENALGDLIGFWLMGRSGREITPEMRGTLEAEGVVLPPEKKPVEMQAKPEPVTIDAKIDAKPSYSDLVKQKFGGQQVIPHDQLQGLLDEFRSGQMAANKIYQPGPATPEEIESVRAQIKELKKTIDASGSPKPPDSEADVTPEWMEAAEKWMEGPGKPLIEKLESLSRDRYRLKNQNAGVVSQLSDGRMVVFLTREGLRTISNARSGNYEPNYDLQGVTIGKPGVDYAYEALQHSESPIAKIVEDLMRKGRNTDGSVTVSLLPEKGEKISNVISVLREELTHAWQHGLDPDRTIDETFPNEVWANLNAAIPQAMKDYLHRNDYDLSNHPEAVTEAGAKLVAFPASEFGMTPSEAANFVFQYFDTMVKKYGAGALDQLVHVNKLGRQMKEYFRGQKPEAAATQRAGTPQDVRSVPAGGSGGLAQNLRLPGNAESLSAGERSRLDQLRNLRYEAHDQSEPFFLKSEALLNDKMKGPMPANSVLAMMNGKIKPEELKWTGLQDFLTKKGNTPVTPQELKDVLAQNDIHIKENVRGGRLIDSLVSQPSTHPIVNFLRYGKGAPRFEKWVMSGGSDYHEMTLTIPEIGHFEHQHWPEKNVLGHVRWDTRMAADGKKLLHLEEIQSDIHQKGRKYGYLKPPREDLTEEQKYQMRTEVKNLRHQQMDALRAGNHEQYEDFQRKADAIDTELGTPKGGEVSEAPFKKNWPELLFRRMLRYAADKGYDGISWTPGDVQAGMYDLSKKIDNINVIPAADGSRAVNIHTPTAGEQIRLMVDKDGKVTPYSTVAHQFAGKDISEMVGKDIAEKIMSAPKETRLSGLDLKVGGEGMHKFYDVMVPSMVNDVGKAWGARVADTTVQYTDKNGAQVSRQIQYLPVTPEMRQSISSQKFSLFNKISPADAVKLDALRNATANLRRVAP